MHIAPSGVLSTKSFIDTFQDLTSLTHGMEIMPDIWMNVTPNQLQDMAAMISPDSEYIDWRAFLLAASQPWPMPTQAQLLETLDKYKEMDQKETGFVTREQFDRVSVGARFIVRMLCHSSEHGLKPLQLYSLLEF